MTRRRDKMGSKGSRFLKCERGEDFWLRRALPILLAESSKGWEDLCGEEDEEMRESMSSIVKFPFLFERARRERERARGETIHIGIGLNDNEISFVLSITIIICR